MKEALRARLARMRRKWLGLPPEPRTPDVPPVPLVSEFARNLPPMPERPDFADYFTLRFEILDPRSTRHLVASGFKAAEAGEPDEVVLSCLLHDVGLFLFRGDHGYWGAQMVAPYVDERVAWAVQYHQALKFFPDEEAGYAYPDDYVRWFGADHRVEPYLERAYETARAHPWYPIARAVTRYDEYRDDPTGRVSIDDFRDLLARAFATPPEGLGHDDSPAAHMWRTFIDPNRFI